jgi:hypothetical protein
MMSFFDVTENGKLSGSLEDLCIVAPSSPTIISVPGAIHVFRVDPKVLCLEDPLICY